MSRPTILRSLLLAGAGLLLFGLGWSAHGWRHAAAKLADRRVRLGGYRLIGPLLDVELPEGYRRDHEPIPFRDEVERFVGEAVRSGRVREMSVYYRDLVDGSWFGVNEDRRYDPASMMKVPVMVAWLKRAEKDPQVLQQVLVFDERTYPGSDQILPAERSLLPRGRYTVDELLRHMLSYSDNKAMWLLFNGLQPQELDRVLDGMDVANELDGAEQRHQRPGILGVLPGPVQRGLPRPRHVREGARAARAPGFPRGIVAGVPRGVTVVRRSSARPRSARGLQLHEFGIVYHPSGPYILGIMTVGGDWDAQAKVLRDLSALALRGAPVGGVEDRGAVAAQGGAGRALTGTTIATCHAVPAAKTSPSSACFTLRSRMRSRSTSPVQPNTFQVTIRTTPVRRMTPRLIQVRTRNLRSSPGTSGAARTQAGRWVSWCRMVRSTSVPIHVPVATSWAKAFRIVSFSRMAAELSTRSGGPGRGKGRMYASFHGYRTDDGQASARPW